MAYVNYGQYQMHVQQQLQQFMHMFAGFTLSAERFNFTGQPMNYLVYKGPIVSHSVRLQFPFKIILPANYPMAAPMVYLDQQAPPEVVARINYLGQQNMV